MLRVLKDAWADFRASLGNGEPTTPVATEEPPDLASSSLPDGAPQPETETTHADARPEGDVRRSFWGRQSLAILLIGAAAVVLVWQYLWPLLAQAEPADRSVVATYEGGVVTKEELVAELDRHPDADRRTFASIAGLHYLVEDMAVHRVVERWAGERRLEDKSSVQYALKHVAEEVKLADINVKLFAQYRVKDPTDYLLRVAYEPDPLVRNAVRGALTTLAGQTNVDDLLTTGRPELQQALQVEAQRTLDRYQSGLQFVNITLQEVNPPKEVADSFRDVASAREDRARAVNEAEGYRNSVVPEARGKAQRALREAEAYRTDVINRATGEAGRFADTLAEYNRSQVAGSEDVTRYRLYVEAMEKVLPKVKKYIVDAAGSGERVTLRILESR